MNEYDDLFDCTYMTFVFRVPEKNGTDAVKAGNRQGITEEYKDHVNKFYQSVDWK